MRESKIERELRAGIEALGGECYKFSSPGRVGVPDRICLFTNRFWFMVETKAPDGVVKPWQEREHNRLRNRGVKVLVLHDLDSVWYVLQWVKQELSTKRRKK